MCAFAFVSWRWGLLKANLLVVRVWEAGIAAVDVCSVMYVYLMTPRDVMIVFMKSDRLALALGTWML